MARETEISEERELIDEFRRKPPRVERTREKEPLTDRERFRRKIESLLKNLSSAFETADTIDESRSESLGDAVSSYIVDETKDRNDDLKLLISEVHLLVSDLFDKDKRLTEIRDQSLEEINKIEERLDVLSYRYQSDERGERDKEIDINYGDLEEEVRLVFDGLKQAIKVIEEYLDYR